MDIANSTPPTDEEMEIYTAAFLACSCADGVLHPLEEAWVMGHQGAFGASPAVLNKGKEMYEKNTLSEILKKFAAHPRLKLNNRGLVFHCISACSADGEMADAELKGTKQTAKALGLTDGDVDALLALYKKQQAVNGEVLKTIWKDSNPFDDGK